MAFTGRFYALTAAQLTTLQTEYLACLSAIASAGQSYTIAGRQFNRANLAEVSQTLGDINDALARSNGTRTTQTFGRFGS
jgi:hypothetical protein